MFVVGMHRAGTSAFAGAIGMLGVPVGDAALLKEGSPSNELGFWEIASLTRFNDDLLAELGGAWASPPPLADGWHDDPRLGDRRRAAARLFARLHPTSQWVWKDPRNCLLLPFWTSALEVAPVLVICHRDPLEIHRSLAARDGIAGPLALALWERYMRSALRAGAGHPALILDYARLLADPAAACAHLRDFLSESGVVCSAPSNDRAAGLVRQELRHAHLGPADQARGATLSGPQRALLARLIELQGAHSRLPAVELAPESEPTELLLCARRDVELRLFHARARARAVAAETARREQAYREKLEAIRQRNARLREKLADQRAKLRRAREKA